MTKTPVKPLRIRMYYGGDGTPFWHIYVGSDLVDSIYVTESNIPCLLERVAQLNKWRHNWRTY